MLSCGVLTANTAEVSCASGVPSRSVNAPAATLTAALPLLAAPAVKVAVYSVSLTFWKSLMVPLVACKSLASKPFTASLNLKVSLAGTPSVS